MHIKFKFLITFYFLEKNIIISLNFIILLRKKSLIKK